MTATLAGEPAFDTIDTARATSVRSVSRWLPWAVLGVCVISFAYGLTTVPNSPYTQWGLLFSASPLLGISILLSAIAFAISVRYHSAAAAATAIFMMVMTQRLPTAAATDYPMFAWTYKHIGVVDYVQTKHVLARGVDIYNSWPGLFASTAWFCDLTGLSPISIAQWFTPAFHIFFTALVFVAARAWGLDQFRALTATMLVALLNWVAQDYFSPQAIALLMTAGIVIIAGISRDRPAANWILILLFAAATVTHQLTPFWLLAMIGLLIVGRKMKPWWIIFPLTAIAIGFLIYNWDEASRYTLFSIDITKNTKTNIYTVGVPGQRVSSYLAMRTLAVGLWVTAGLTLLYRMWKRQPFWAQGVLALSPMLIVGGQNYGGEAVFRVYLYSLIGCSIVLAPAITAWLQGSAGRYACGMAALVVCTALSAQGYFGAWHANLMPKIQVDTSRQVLAGAELPAYLTPVAPVWPQRSSWNYVDYVKFTPNFDDPMIYATNLVGSHFDTEEDYQKFLESLAGRTDASTYLIFTDQMRMYSWYYGILPWDALPNLKARMLEDTEHWKPFFEGQGITVFVHQVRAN